MQPCQDPDFPPFLVDRPDSLNVEAKIAASQIQIENACTPYGAPAPVRA
ncbi:hypothetical protein [Endozoicomonas sp. SESOKO2]|nr:hypothetical protein [Endozoicomonas sp. SESOKO2]